MDDLVISVVGLGKLGSPLLACFASRGIQVIGVDVNEHTLEHLGKGRAPVFEPHLEELLQTNRERISVTPDYTWAVRESSMTFVVVPTPSQTDGLFSLKHVLAACEKIGEALRQKSGFHVVVITSTMLPEDMESAILPALERWSGKRCGRDFGLCSARVIVVATPWQEFKRLQPEQFAHNPRRMVLDCWRILPAEQMSSVADYFTIGKFPPCRTPPER